MSRRFAFLLAAVAFVPPGCGQPAAEVVEVPPVPAVRPALIPPDQIIVTTAEKIDEPEDKNLALTDPGLDSNLEAKLPEIDRLDKQTVDAIVIADPIDVPPPAGDKLDDPPAPPPSFPGRMGATKAKLIREGGGNADSEKAVARGLAWLAKQQKDDGSWEFDQGCKDKKVAATGLALLPFLGAGERHTDDKAKYKDTVKTGLDWLVKNRPAVQPKVVTGGDGDMYEQAIAALALCEAYGMTKDKDLKPAAQAAVDFIQKSQGPNGSWGYSPGSDGDTSIVGWQIQALQAAKLSKDLVVDDRVIKKAIKFLDSTAAGPRKSMYGYSDSAGAAAGTSLTAVGLLCRYSIDGWGPNHPGMIDGVGGLAKNPPPGKGAVKNLYYFYYATQVMHFYEGEDWKNWNEGPKVDGVRKGGMRDWLVSNQNRKDGEKLGSWDPEGGSFGSNCGRLGTTAIALLTLEVYYRHLPLYKRGADGGAVKILEDK